MRIYAFIYYDIYMNLDHMNNDLCVYLTHYLIMILNNYKIILKCYHNIKIA